MPKQKRILICPLDWGLGHATRCVPIIRLLLKKNAEVIIVADGRALALLKIEFPDLKFISLKGYDISYSENNFMIMKMIFSIPKILFGIYKEHQALKKIVAENKIDIVISDNRFGLWNKQVQSIFITHQLMIKTPFFEKLLHQLNLFFIKKYDECWIPDFEGEANLSGDLAHKYSLLPHTFFIGLLSRFNAEKANESNYKYDVMAIVSGPEPQRSIFEKQMLQQFSKTNLKALIVCGKTETEQKKEMNGNCEIVSHLKADEMQTAILNSKIIIARSGYSTIMDLATLAKSAVFIATPGQTEQKYLADSLMQKNIAYSVSQDEFDLNSALKESKKFKGFNTASTTTDLENRIDFLLNLS